MPGGRKTPISIPVPKEAFSGEEPTAVGSDPIAALETIDRRLKGLAREHKDSVQVDQAEHMHIRTSVEGLTEKVETLNGKIEQSEDKLESKIEDMGTRMDARFDGIHSRLDVISNSQLTVKVTEKQAEIQLNTEKQAADTRINTEKKIAKISGFKEIVLKIVGPFFGALGALAAAYAAGFLHGC